MFVDKLATLFSQHLEGSGLEWPCPADIYPPYLPRSFLQAQSLPQASEVSGGAAIYAGTNAAHPNNIHRCKVCEAQNQPLPGGSSCLQLHVWRLTFLAAMHTLGTFDFLKAWIAWIFGNEIRTYSIWRTGSSILIEFRWSCHLVFGNSINEINAKK